LATSETELAPVCILAGGLGTRLGEQVRDTPKPLLVVAGEPFVFHQLRLLRRHGARRIVLCVGYLGELIEEAVGDGGRFGLEVAYSYDGPNLKGTAGAVRQALPLLGDEVLVLYGDTYLRIDYPDVQRAFRQSGLPALMTVLRNEGLWDTSNVRFANGRVVAYDKDAPTTDMLWIDYGLGMMRSEAVSGSEHEDLAGIYAELARRGELAGYEASERFYEIGTPDSLRETDEFLASTAS
jgi:N-acetyl-alpha-D-muramate 1-phosphate uridylyltransferase